MKSRLILIFLLLGYQAGLGQVTSETCLDCHDGYDKTLVESPHALKLKVRAGSTTIGCTSCHGDGDAHVDDPTIDNILCLASSGVHKMGVICTECHNPHLNENASGMISFAELDLSCVSCHAIHSSDNDAINQSDVLICEKCHKQTANEFIQRSNHPLGFGGATCTGCHDFIGKASPDFGHGTGVNCVSCHPEQSGPFIAEHEATSTFSTEGSGCISCHSPHGSPNDRLLTQPGNGLCRQCHSEGVGHSATAHDGAYASLECIDCHSQVHGSFDFRNRFLLDQDLGLKLTGNPEACYCHRRN
ncbi:MAG: cytochrome c3 family protein [candidate division Zixibacteria bacterium]